MTTRGTQSFVVKPEIVSAADLKGKIVGVSGFGGSTHHGALFVLEHLGVDPKDVAILNVGNSSLRLAALSFKKIDATILDTAFLRKAEELGFKRLVSLADLGEIPSTGLVVTATKLKKQPEQIRRVVRATLKGTNYFKENRGEMVSFIAKKLSVETKEAEELHELGVKVFSNSGRISDEGLNVLLRQRDPKRQVPIQPSDVDCPFSRQDERPQRARRKGKLKNLSELRVSVVNNPRPCSQVAALPRWVLCGEYFLTENRLSRRRETLRIRSG